MPETLAFSKPPELSSDDASGTVPPHTSGVPQGSKDTISNRRTTITRQAVADEFIEFPVIETSQPTVPGRRRRRIPTVKFLMVLVTFAWPILIVAIFLGMVYFVPDVKAPERNRLVDGRIVTSQDTTPLFKQIASLVTVIYAMSMVVLLVIWFATNEGRAPVGPDIPATTSSSRQYPGNAGVPNSDRLIRGAIVGICTVGGVIVGCIVGFFAAHHFAFFGGFALIGEPYSPARDSLVPGHMLLCGILLGAAGFGVGWLINSFWE
jgi:hypothetical protein